MARELAGPSPPNVLMIMMDDLSPIEDLSHPDAANLYRENAGPYPFVRKLKQSGMRFRTAWATAICSSSRLLALTGQRGYHNGYYGLINRPFTPKPTSPYYQLGGKQTLARRLQAKGYRTGLVGKWQLPGDPRRGMIYEAGFEEYLVWLQSSLFHVFPELDGRPNSRYWSPVLLHDGELVLGGASDYGPAMFADWAIDFIRRHRNEKWFLYYPMVLPHRQDGGFPPIPDGSGGTLPGSLRAFVRYLDSILGQVVATLGALGLADDTLVVLTSDNGSKWPGFKGTPTERGVRVPLYIAYPRAVAANVTSRQVTDLADVIATIDDYTGPSLISAPEPSWDGVSLRSVLEDPNQNGQTRPARPHKQYAVSYYGDRRLVRDDRWVYQDVDPAGNGELFHCGTSRSWDRCRSSTRQAKINEFKDVLASHPPPDVEGQDLIPPA